MFNKCKKYAIMKKIKGVAMKKQKNNKLSIRKILSLPFLAIYYIVDFFFKSINWFFTGVFFVFKPIFILLKYECLGCYYIVRILLFPFTFILNKISDGIYKFYESRQKVDLSDMISHEEVNLNTDETSEEDSEEDETPKKLTVEEYFKKKYEEFFLVKKMREKERMQTRELLESIKKNNNRSDKPVAFKYTARDEKGKKVTNIFIALSKMEVYSYLHNEGYTIFKIETSKWINLLYGSSQSYVYKLKNKDLIFWLTQLSTYLKSGIPLTNAVRILSKQMSDSPRKKRLFDSIIYNLTLGEAFSSALEKQGKSFPVLLISMIKTAEATGDLEATLDDMANYYTDIENTRKAMISAMTYPTVVMLFSVAVVVFIMLYVIPKFQDIYTTSGATLNGLTLAIISISKYLQENIIKLLIGFVLIVILIVVLYKSIKVVRKGIQKFLMKLPVIGNIIIYKEMNIFSKTFASLLNNNVFITESMSLLSEVTSNEIYKEIMFETINYIVRGDKISTAFSNHWAVPEVAYYMIVTGESTGKLGEMMAKVADYYQTEHKTVIDSLKSLIEPALIVFLALVVGGIVIAIVLPMFGLYSQLQ